MNTFITPPAGTINLAPSLSSFDSSQITLDSGIVTLDAAMGGVAPLINTRIAPAVGSIAVSDANLTGPIQIYTLPAPIPGQIAVVGYAPLLPVTNMVIAPAATSLAWGSYAPIQMSYSVPGPGAISLTGIAAVQAIAITPQTGSIAYINGIPTVQGRYDLQPPTGTLALGGQAPITGTVITPAAATALAITGYSPTLVIGIQVVSTPPSALLALTGSTPTIGVGFQVQGTSVAYSSYAPIVSVSSVLIPGAAAIALTCSAPAQNSEIFTGTGSIGVSGGIASISTQGPYDFVPTAGAVAFTGQAPVTISNTFITPAAGSLSLVSQQPVVYSVVRPPSAALALTTFAPTVLVSLAPGAAQLALTGTIPEISFTSPQQGPPAGWLSFSGCQPVLSFATPSVREQILSYLASACSAATGVMFSFSRSRMAPVSRRESIVATLIVERDVATYKANRFVTRELYIKLVVVARQDVPDSWLNPSLNLIHAACMASPTVNGLAALIIDSDNEWTFALADQDAVVASRRFAIRYAPAWADLTSLA